MRACVYVCISMCMCICWVEGDMCKRYRSRPLTERRSCTHGTLCTESGDNGLHHSQYDWTRGTPPVTDQHTRYTTCYRPTRVVHHLLQTNTRDNLLQTDTRGTPPVTDQHTWYTTCYRPTHVITCYRPTHVVHHLLQTNTRRTQPVTDQHTWYTTCYSPTHVVVLGDSGLSITRAFEPIRTSQLIFHEIPGNQWRILPTR